MRLCFARNRHICHSGRVRTHQRKQLSIPLGTQAFSLNDSEHHVGLLSIYNRLVVLTMDPLGDALRHPRPHSHVCAPPRVLINVTLLLLLLLRNPTHPYAVHARARSGSQQANLESRIERVSGSEGTVAIVTISGLS